MNWAMWYMQHQRAYYELYETKDEALRAMFYMEWGAPMGVQGSDGSWIDDESEDYDEIRTALIEQEMAASAAAATTPPKPLRRVVVPWGGRTAEIPVDAPSWLGA